ncbi:MAG: hypothetical protein Q8Q09_08580 [Deltaproteobacteria bacterium]|nr:hypothetical protein [Deltaproteobacteria bacterium]
MTQRSNTVFAGALVCLSLMGCARSCGEPRAVREKSSREWRATARCQSDPAGVRAWILFRVDCFTGGHAEVVVPGSERRGNTVGELQRACRESQADIQFRETEEGTVLAASVAGASESAVIYRARNSAVFAASAVVSGDSHRAVLSAPTPVRAVLLALDRGELRDSARSPMIDAIDPTALAAHRATLISYGQRCLVPASLVTLMVKASPDEIATQFFDAAYVSGDCRSLQNGLESAPRDVVGPLVERWFREHRDHAAPWPVALHRYATAHGLSLLMRHADVDAAVSDAAR